MWSENIWLRMGVLENRQLLNALILLLESEYTNERYLIEIDKHSQQNYLNTCIYSSKADAYQSSG